MLDRWRDWYPPEVLGKKIPDHRTDLFMAAKTMIQLLGGDAKHNTFLSSVPEKMQRILLQCVQDSPARRPSDGRYVLDEFTRVITDLWGRAYRRLDHVGQPSGDSTESPAE